MNAGFGAVHEVFIQALEVARFSSSAHYLIPYHANAQVLWALLRLRLVLIIELVPVLRHVLHWHWAYHFLRILVHLLIQLVLRLLQNGFVKRTFDVWHHKQQRTRRLCKRKSFGQTRKLLGIKRLAEARGLVGFFVAGSRFQVDALEGSMIVLLRKPSLRLTVVFG